MNLIAPSDHEWVEPIPEERHNLFRAVQEGFWPFKPGMVEMETSYDIDFMTDYLWVGVYFSDIFFPFRFKYDRDDLIAWPGPHRAEMATRVFNACRNRGSAVVPSNIILGEE